MPLIVGNKAKWNVRFFFLGCASLAALFLFAHLFLTPSFVRSYIPEEEMIVLQGMPYRFERARTPEAQRIGLSGREALFPFTGMHFIFLTPDRYRFWMKGMRFPLDFIFVRDGVIVDLAKNIRSPRTPEEEPVIIHPVYPFTDVLEIPAGDVDQRGLRIGQKISLP